MTCTHWSLASGMSAFRCSQPAVEAGACLPHLRYPSPGADDAPVEPRRA